MEFVYKRSANEEKTNNNVNSNSQPELKLQDSSEYNSSKDPESHATAVEVCDPNLLIKDKLNHNNNRKCDQPVTDIDIVNDTKVLGWKHPTFYFEVDRDYSGISSTEIRFSTVFPKQLDGSVSEDVFVNTIEGINVLFDDAERVSWGTTLESLLWYSTCTLMGCCVKTRFEKALLKMCSFIYEQNDTIYHPRGLHIVHPVVRNLLVIGVRNISHYRLYPDNVSTTIEDTNCSNSAIPKGNQEGTQTRRVSFSDKPIVFEYRNNKKCSSSCKRRNKVWR